MSIESIITVIGSTPDPRVRWQYIRAALLERGVTLVHIAAEVGVVPQAVSQAAVFPSAPVEEAIAKALACHPRRLFPERYNVDGSRRCMTMGRRRRKAEAA